MKNIIVGVALCLLAVMCRDALCDTLYLKNGAEHQGKIISQDENKVVLRIGPDEDGVDVVFSSDEVLRIDTIDSVTAGELPMVVPEPAMANLTKPLEVYLGNTTTAKKIPLSNPPFLANVTRPLGSNTEKEAVATAPSAASVALKNEGEQAAREEQPSEEDAVSVSDTTTVMTPSESTTSQPLLGDLEGERLKKEDEQIVRNMKKYLDQTNRSQ